MEITGPFVNGRYVGVAIVYKARVPELVGTVATIMGTITKWLEGVWGRYGNPSGLVTDNGPQFISAAFLG